MNIAAIHSGLDEVAHAVAAAQDTVARGGMVDFTGLDRDVHVLCHAVAGLPRAQGRALTARLLGLVDDLNRLIEVLGKARDAAAAAATVDAAATPQQAAAAYQKPQP